MTAKIYLALALHNHQPVGNFDFVCEEAYQKSYLPMLEALERHPGVRLAIHNTGCLLDWLMKSHPEYIERMGDLVARNQIEIMTGGYYEPILVSLPDVDKQGQIKKLTHTVDDLFGYEARGAWLAERVWEPHLPKSLNQAGIDYTIVDDTHFRYAGLGNDDMFGYYVTEEQGHTVNIFGTSQKMRYMLPYSSVDEVMGWLWEEAHRKQSLYDNVTKVAVMGDDGEKFGLWPGTYQHCWVNGWIDQLFTAIEANASWLQTTTLSDYMEKEQSLGQLYMPAASYDEMTEWSLPSGNSAELVNLKHRLQDEHQHHVLKFIKGGAWRGFLAKYPESNLMHKKSLWVSEKIQNAPDGDAKTAALEKLWAAQCNCGYWHGLFGGVYLFHIRGINYRNLIEAEMLIDNSELELTRTDFTRDGHPNLIMANQHQWLLFDLHRGGSLIEWDFRDARYNLLNNMTRRHESYHQDIIDAAQHGSQKLSGDNGPAENVHSKTVRVREYGLENKLSYDWYRRGAFQDRFLDTATTFENYSLVHGEKGDFVNQPYEVEVREQTLRLDVMLSRKGGIWQGDQFLPISLWKQIQIEPDTAVLKVTYTIANRGAHTVSTRFCSENNWGLEGGQDHLTYFLGLGEGKKYPGRSGQAKCIERYCLSSEISTVRTHIDIRSSQPMDVWWHPIETVTNSEVGYEANYQGTITLNSWVIAIEPGSQWQVTLEVDLSTL